MNNPYGTLLIEAASLSETKDIKAWVKNCSKQKEKNYKEEKADDGNRR